MATEDVLVFDIEDADCQTGTRDSSVTLENASLEALVLRLELAARQPSELARKLRHDVLQLHSQLPAGISPEALLNVLAAKLAGRGFEDVRIRAALGGGDECFKSLRNEFLVVRGHGEFEGMELIVEPAFRQHFAIPHPSPQYAAALALVPEVFVGAAFRLLPVVQTLCGLMADSFAAQGLALPPWRKEAAMLSKWLPSPSRLHDIKCFTPGPTWPTWQSNTTAAAAAATASTAAAAPRPSVITGFQPPQPSSPVVAVAAAPCGSVCGSPCGSDAGSVGGDGGRGGGGCCGASDLLSAPSSDTSSSSDDADTRATAASALLRHRSSCSVLLELGLGLGPLGDDCCGGGSAGGGGGGFAFAACGDGDDFDDLDDGILIMADAEAEAEGDGSAEGTGCAVASRASYRPTCTGMLIRAAAAPPLPAYRPACTGMIPGGGRGGAGGAGSSGGGAGGAGTGLLSARLVLCGLAERCLPPDLLAEATAAATAGSARQRLAAAAAAQPCAGPRPHLVRLGWPAELIPAASAAEVQAQAQRQRTKEGVELFPELASGRCGAGGVGVLPPPPPPAAPATPAASAEAARSWLPWKLNQ